MHSQARPFSILIVICLVFAPFLHAQDNPLNDPDLQDALKQARELEKQSGPSKPVKMSDLKKQADEIQAEQEKEEKREKEKLQASLKKQLEARGPVAFPDWTPATPQFKAAGAPTRKIVEDQVKIIQTGSSSLTPKDLADSWETAAVGAKNLNHGRNNISVNGKLTTITFLSTRTDPVQKMKLEASREPGSKITEVEISSPLPKPDIESE